MRHAIRTLLFINAILLSNLLFQRCNKYDAPPRILIFSRTEGYRHESIPTAVAALRTLCTEKGIMVDSTEDSEAFTDKNLCRYAAVVFLSTTGDVLDPKQEVAFERYIQAGGGFVGIHAATDTEYGWSWYGGLVGAYFNDHPAIQDATLQVKNQHHISTKHLRSDTWQRRDEWYSFRNLNPALNILLTIDEKSYQGGTNGENHPMAWYHEYDGGRAFYTGGGHTKESYAEPDFLKHLLGGIQYAIGNNKKPDYRLCRTQPVPDPTRFVKTVLADELTEPMEFAMFPDGKIIVVERRGAIKLFDPNTGLINTAYQLPVHSKFEDGLMGVALDPNWVENHWIYLYYSPVGKEAVNHLSRFVFTGDTLDRKSEKVLLKVKTQRDECCHAGGSVAFDAQGNLYVSTGDNTNPFASDGYAPIDERPRRSPWDAQKSSANTKDLRGKILRITPHADGSYSCPADNLFARDTTQGRPEIYVMGCRNPFRISIDDRRKLLFWGEVGPDAGDPDSARGPAGHDEVNRARAAGFFGWPYFVGNNKPYRDYNFAAKKNGPPFDPAHPVNNSPNNTGARELPPAQPAFIWYPYTNSTDFPLVGNGGRNAMAGPVYYGDQYPEATRFPDYYNGKLITYDWMRNWMMAVTLDSLGNFSRMEPFGDSIRLSRPMDMLVDKNGSIWVLEYGAQWFSSNPDARLSRIDFFKGNRPPMPQLQADKTAGAAPLKVCFSMGKTRDYDNDRLSYTLDFGDGTAPFVLNDQGPVSEAVVNPVKKMPRRHALDSVSHLFEKPGVYETTLKIRDPEGAISTVKQKIYVGNEPPAVYWDFAGKNRSFYNPGDILQYKVTVSDLEDGSLEAGGIAQEAVATTIDYLETGFDITAIAQGHLAAMQNVEYTRGKSLVDRSDCKTCHATDRQINGPAYQAIAERYRDNEFAVTNLSRKIITGGAGVWGQTVMSAHPQLTEESAAEMVRWILSLGDAPKLKKSMPPQGSFALTVPPPKEKNKKTQPGTYLLRAVYRDRGSSAQAPLESGEVLALRPAYLQAESADSLSKNIRPYRPSNGDTVVLNELKHRSFFVVKRVDLRGLKAVSIGLGSGDARYHFVGGRIELHLDGPNGPLAGQVTIPVANSDKKMSFSEVVMNLEPTEDATFRDLYFVLKNENAPSQFITAVDWIRFNF